MSESGVRKGLGWRPDVPDIRDFRYGQRGVIKKQKSIPRSYDLRHLCPPVYDQGQLGACTAFAIGSLYQFLQRKQGQEDYRMSELFIYYNERDYEGTVDSDSGAMIRTGMKVVNKLGAAANVEWPYEIKKFRNRPFEDAYGNALNHQSITYESIPRDVTVLKQLIYQGFPFVFGFAVYESFYDSEVANSGLMRMPQQDETMLGGHAVMGVGYDDDKQMFVIRNSWSEEWGDFGYFYMPYAYIMEPRLSMDFWTMRTVE